MKRGRRVAKRSRGTRTSPSATLVAGAILLALGLALAITTMLRDGGDDGAAAPDGDGADIAFSDIHGLAVHPERPSVLYVATHHGLIRGENGTGWERVGDSRDDMMGFTMHPTDGNVMWISGHPVGGGNMGVRQSTDGGLTWRDLPLRAVDFHVMTVSRADGDRLWGYWYTGQLYRSDDVGQTWSTDFETPPDVRALATHPTDRDVLFAATRDALWRTDDAARSWTRVAALEASALAVDPQDGERLWATTRAGVARSDDGGATWTRVDGSPADPRLGHVAVDPLDPDVVYVATYDAGIWTTRDGGATWQQVKPPER